MRGKLSSEKDVIENLQKELKSQKIKTIPLKVSAPFHCSLMRPAAQKMTQKIINGIEELFSTWEPKSRFSFVKDTSYKRKTLPHKLSY